MENPIAVPELAAQDRAWWRTVLGEYPTGVTLITALGDDGEPIGMIVGTFTAVSEEPPLIGFLPGRTSWSFGQIRNVGRFAVSVLGTHHEALCRAFATRDPDRFALGEWATTPAGIPRLVDAVSWYEASLASTTDVGDHAFVVADVTAFGVGDGGSGLPLLYLKGGYGSFAIPSSRLDYQRLGASMRLADGMREAMASFAARHQVVVTLTTVSGDSVVILAAEGGTDAEEADDIVGFSFPFAAPLAPSLVAWSDVDRQKTWTENSRHLVGRVNRPQLAELLQRVRDRGFAVSLGSAMASRFDMIAADPGINRAELAALWAAVEEETSLIESDGQWYAEVSSIQVPVFGADGTVDMELAVNGIGPGLSRETVEAMVADARTTASRLTELAAPHQN